MVSGSVLSSPLVNISIADGPAPQIKSVRFLVLLYPTDRRIACWYRIFRQYLFDIHIIDSFCIVSKLFRSILWVYTVSFRRVRYRASWAV